jgi:hypothetical protein
VLSIEGNPNDDVKLRNIGFAVIRETGERGDAMGEAARAGAFTTVTRIAMNSSIHRI